jgi:23S rRNA pseudouridine1911/1915/1917 synthase
MDFKTIYEDENLLVIDKPAGIITSDLYPNLKKVHRLDKDTSGVLLIAKNEKSLIFLQKQFKNRKVEKRYVALVVGNPKNEQGTIETLIGRAPRDRRKQKVYFPLGPNAKGKREAITKYKVIKSFKDYTLFEVILKTGRKHQIRCHFSYLGHPIAGDKMYGFKNQPCPKELKRQFLHASYIKIKLPDEKIKEFKSILPDDLKLCLQKLKLLPKIK